MNPTLTPVYYTHDATLAVAGELVAILGWKDAVIRETLSASTKPLVLESIRAQPPLLLTIAISPPIGGNIGRAHS